LRRLVIALALATIGLAAPARAALRVVVLDVGEGLSVVLQDGDHGVLIDTGHLGMAGRVVSRIAAYGVDELDLWFLTHLHDDHASGYFRVREAFPATPVLESCHPIETAAADVFPDVTRWVAKALAADPLRRCVRSGTVLRWRETSISVVWPDHPEGRNLNRHSLVLRIRRGGATVLVMGDADSRVERTLVDSGRVRDPVTMLVAGHHGARDTGDESFLAAVRPRLSVVSVDRGNVRGYPAEATLRLLAETSGAVARTDRDGDVCREVGPGPEDLAPCAGAVAEERAP
jgi:beta-lactamase superfamily II metal-dependent hydrolase